MKDSNDLYFAILNFNDEVCNQLYDEFHALIWFVAKGKIDDVETIKDLEMEIYGKIIQNIDKVKDPKKFKNYVGSIINNTIFSYLRNKNKEKIEVLDRDEIEIVAADHVEDDRSIKFEDILQYLDKKERIILSNRIMFQLPFREIGMIIDESEQTVRRRYRSAIAKIRVSLDNDGYYVSALKKKIKDKEAQEKEIENHSKHIIKFKKEDKDRDE